MLRHALEWGLCCAMVSVVYTMVVRDHMAIMQPWFNMLNRMERNGWSMLAKPIGNCEMCFAGQLALWTSLYFSGWSIAPLSIASHLTTAAAAIILAPVVGKLYIWTQH